MSRTRLKCKAFGPTFLERVAEPGVLLLERVSKRALPQGATKMIDADYLRRQAENCLNLSRATFDLVIASRLRAMADEFRRKAQELDAAYTSFPLHMTKGNGSSVGKKM